MQLLLMAVQVVCDRVQATVLGTIEEANAAITCLMSEVKALVLLIRRVNFWSIFCAKQFSVQTVKALLLHRFLLNSFKKLTCDSAKVARVVHIATVLVVQMALALAVAI